MQNIEKIYSIKDLAKVNGGPLPMSVSGLYNACRRGEICCIKIGKRIFVSEKTLKRLLAQ